MSKNCPQRFVHYNLFPRAAVHLAQWLLQQRAGAAAGERQEAGGGGDQPALAGVAAEPQPPFAHSHEEVWRGWAPGNTQTYRVRWPGIELQISRRIPGGFGTFQEVLQNKWENS